jgi:DNA-binding response OmpR family regulator
VDAEPGARFARHVLESDGFRVLAARNAAEALEAAADAAGLDLVIAEAELPDMPGSDLVRRLREARPRLKALLMSGDPDAPAEPGWTEFLGKPFAPEELAGRASRLVDPDSGAL